MSVGRTSDGMRFVFYHVVVETRCVEGKKPAGARKRISTRAMSAAWSNASAQAGWRRNHSCRALLFRLDSRLAYRERRDSFAPFTARRDCFSAMRPFGFPLLKGGACAAPYRPCIRVPPGSCRVGRKGPKGKECRARCPVCLWPRRDEMRTPTIQEE